MKLLNDIINLLMNESGSLNEALLKTKVLLHKIGQSDLVDWVNDEINGYADTDQVPEYRRIQARVLSVISNRAYRYTNYQLPLFHLEPKLREGLETAPMGQSLGVLETLVGDGKGHLRTPVAPELYDKLGEVLNGGYIVIDAWSQIEQTQVRQVLIEVRSRLLDFVLALQDTIGEDMSDEDVKKATTGLDVRGMFHGAVLGDNVTILVGHQSQQHVSNTNVKHDAAALADELRSKGVAEKDIQALNTAIAHDPAPTTAGQYGPAVKAWMSNMLSKAVDSSWKISISAAGGVLAGAIKNYYGI